MNENQDNVTTKPTLDLWLDRIISGGILIFLGLLPFHLVIKRLIPDPVGTYWKEALLVLMVLIWGLRCVLAKRILLSDTALDLPVLLYAGIILLHLIVERTGMVALWGAYISILYLPLFFLIPQALRRFPRLTDGLIIGMTVVGALVSIGGILEFLIDKPLWPSVELTLRQGFPDMYVYGTHLRRVYFVFDSPTTLANTLAMILPLSILAIFQPYKLWVRILAGLCAVLIFTTILLTFSRGILVALGLTAVILVLMKVISERNWKFLRLSLVAGVLGVLILVLVWLSTPISKSNVDKFSIELLPEAYRTLSLGDHSVTLVAMQPLTGELEKQIWTIFDPIEQRHDQRTVVYMHPKTDGPLECLYEVTVPDRGLLRFSIALSPEVWTPEKGDGVNFKIYIQENDTENGEFVFNRYINPKSNPNDRRWRNYAVDLAMWSGKKVSLSLIVEAGPAGDYGYDWSGWADLDLGTADEGYVSTNWPEPKNPVVEHLGSIMDWTKDESNRDRIAAWNLAFSAWAQSPIWGNGLGTSGTAALRTIPETAIVTESQPLKSVVELGIPGLLTWGYLWLSIFRSALLLYRKDAQSERKILTLGILSSLLVIFIDGLVYQNLEVKQVNAFFWTLVGILAFTQSQFKSQQSPGVDQS